MKPTVQISLDHLPSKHSLPARLLIEAASKEFNVILSDNSPTSQKTIEEFKEHGHFEEALISSEIQPKDQRVVENFVFRQMPSDLELLSTSPCRSNHPPYNVGSKKAKKERFLQKKRNKALRRSAKNAAI